VSHPFSIEFDLVKNPNLTIAMKKIFLSLLSLLCFGSLNAQKFQEVFNVALPDSIIHAKAQWHDMNNDGLLDILLVAGSSTGHAYLLFIKGDTTQLPQIDTIIAIPAHETFATVDLNRDNRLDILVSGEKDGLPFVTSYINQGDFTFFAKPSPFPPFSIFRFGDVDNDGYADGILATDTLMLFFPGNDAGFEVARDTFRISPTDLEVFDYDNDSKMDLFVSGRVSADSSFTGMLIQQDRSFSAIPMIELAGNGTVAHLDNDGFLDIVFSADSAGVPINRIFNRGVANVSADFNMNVTASMAADFNADGLTDIAVLGRRVDGDTVNLIRYSNMDYDTLPSHNIVDQFFSDPEHDGDLDVLQIIRQDSLHVVVMINQDTIKNEGALAPPRSIALDIFGHILIYWDKATDDHTASELLTYDLRIGNALGILQSSNFDLLNRRRLTAEHGNTGSQHFRFISNLNSNGFTYQIQSIDNALHAAPAGICNGIGASVCLNVSTAEYVVNACRGKNITLSGPEGVLWFSFRDGYRGTGSKLDHDVSQTDTLFYFDPADGSCWGVKLFRIIVEEDTITTMHKARYACESSTIEFNLAPNLQPATWSSAQLGQLDAGMSLHFMVTRPDTITATVTNNHCSLIYITPVALSKPDIQVEADHYKILKGSGVQLKAAGGLQYTWYPAEGLSDASISNPIATPLETTRYTVTGSDSLGCSGEASLTIVVEETGFIPTLFTPNEDGKNDLLKVYGLSVVKDLSFSIFNREGIRVFHANSLSDALAGWDGTYHGSRQPAGVYFWKVSGSLVTGEKLMLNGKESGSLILIR
jgi:gliding motility-associated-like protein